MKWSHGGRCAVVGVAMFIVDASLVMGHVLVDIMAAYCPLAILSNL